LWKWLDVLLQTNLSKSMWAEALNTAVYLRNRSATKSLDGMTPIEAWSRKKPYVGHLRTKQGYSIKQRRKKRKVQTKRYINTGRLLCGIESLSRLETRRLLLKRCKNV